MKLHDDIVEEYCSRDVPKALATSGHDFPVYGVCGVILGVTRCRWCNAAARTEHFDPSADPSPCLPGR